MTTAIKKVHMPNGPWAANGGAADAAHGNTAGDPTTAGA
jgi:hypothetical protein